MCGEVRGLGMGGSEGRGSKVGLKADLINQFYLRVSKTDPYFARKRNSRSNSGLTPSGP